MPRPIDADALQELCNNRILDLWNSRTSPVSWDEAYADFKDDIDSIPTLTPPNETPPCYQPDGDGCAYQCYDGDDEPIDKCKECPLCYSDKQRHHAPPNDPLTLEQLRQMDGEPVWCVSKIEENVAEWMIVDGRMSVCEGREYVADFREIGYLWTAYAYPPAHIDLEEWEPCSKCRSCASCLSSIESVKYYPCLQCERYENFSPRNFCPECGRPLTPEARAMLEKRLRG